MLTEFTAQSLTLEVLAHLERRRATLAGDPAGAESAAREALAPLRAEYLKVELPAGYFDAVEREILAVVPARWARLALEFTSDEQRAFGVWREGDPLSRMVYVGAGLALGGFIVWAPFIPIWEKWLPFAMAIGAWWLPDLQTAWKRRRYARTLGRIAAELGDAQPALDRHLDTDLLLAEHDESRHSTPR